MSKLSDDEEKELAAAKAVVSRLGLKMLPPFDEHLARQRVALVFSIWFNGKPASK